MTETQEPLPRKNCRISTFFAEASLVKAFQSLERGAPLPIPVERSFLKLPGLPPLKDLRFCSLKMSLESCRLTEAGSLRPSSLRWMSWGISTGVKVIIAVVIGALILGGLYLLFAGDNGILSKVSDEVEDMMGYTQELRVEKQLDEATGKYKVRYSYDGKRWQDADMPDYGETATVEKIISNNAESGRIDAMLISDGDKKVILTSTDGGIHWAEQIAFTATSITHFYYGTSASLPSTSGSFQGERFVCRYKSGNFYTMTSDGTRWVKPTWSDLIPIS